MAGTAQANSPAVTFQASDEPGSWFECTNTHKTASKIGCAHLALGEASVGKSLAVINLGETIAFSSAGQANTLHTAVDLLYPTPASGTHTPFDVDLKPGRGKKFTVTPTDPGLHVFFCDIHPYMFAAVIVNDPNTEGLDLGATIDLPEVLASGITGLPVTSDLALRLVHTFFVVTNPANWQSFPATGTADWNTSYPAVPVNVGGAVVPDLDVFLRGYFKEGGPGVTPATRKTLAAPSMPVSAKGVGQVWVDTQFEKVTEKTKPGTATAVNATTWKVERKVALPHINMNNPHNMWTDRNQTLIYQTQWFDNTLAVFKRTNGHFLRNIQVGPAPAHVMTRTNNDQVHVSLNGGNDVVEFAPLATHIEKNIPMSDPSEGHDTHPHGHWMSADGAMMVTPNPDTEDSTLYDFEPFNTIGSRTPTGHHSLATSMMPDSSKY